MRTRQVIICVLAMILISFIHGAVHKIDVTVFRSPPLKVGRSSTTDVVYQGAVSNEYADVTFNIGRTSYTGTGSVGEEVVDPADGAILPRPPFPTGSRVNYPSVLDSKRMDVILEGNVESIQRRERFGAFYLKAVLQDGTEVVKITTIIRNSEATIIPSSDTVTVSIGDSVTLQVSTFVPYDGLRWRHNGSPYIDEWQGMIEVTIDNVRKADEGIYECHEDGKRGRAEHAIMRLIVRTCPNGKWGPDCLRSCGTCYNGGFCEPSSGVCVCPPGFHGSRCEQPCDVNFFGGECSIECASGGCQGRRLCEPDPVGCSCISGYEGYECITACSGKSYGTNCEQTCHCLDESCDKARGCSGVCDTGYFGPGCQVPPTCDDGSWGGLCENHCHCTTTCDRTTGQCESGHCYDGWGNTDCQQPLPSFYEFQPTVDANYSSLTIHWDAWNADTDYGIGPVEKYQVYLAESGQSLEPYCATTNTSIMLTGLKHGATYDYAVSVFRRINNIPYEGVMGPTYSFTTICGVPSYPPTITNTTTIGSYEIEVEWMIPEDIEWIECITAFLISDKNGLLKRVEDKSTRKTVIDQLYPCTPYQLFMQVANEENLSPKSNVTTATTAPEQVPNVYVTTVSSDAIIVSWTQLTQCSSIEYLVSYGPTFLDQCLTEKDPPIQEILTTTASILIEDLQAHSTYEIAVSGIINNVQGGGIFTYEITEEAVPSGTPSNIISTVNGTQLTYTWEQPKCGSRRGNITGYDYVFGINIKDGQVEYGSLNQDERLIVFGQLDYNKKYQFQIRANTSAGAGPYSSIIKTSTPTNNEPSSGVSIVLVAVATPLAFIATGAIVFAIVVLMRSRRYRKEHSDSNALPVTMSKLQHSTAIGSSTDEPYTELDLRTRKGQPVYEEPRSATYEEIGDHGLHGDGSKPGDDAYQGLKATANDNEAYVNMP